jgi:transposase-like protein
LSRPVAGNNCNGHGSKTVVADDGELTIAVPRDRSGSFEPQVVPKGVSRLEGFDDRVISLYARGLSVHEIRGHLRELYGIEASADLISRVTDAVMEEVQERQNRALDPLYPVIFLDALQHLAAFEVTWGARHPTIGPLWRRAWETALPLPGRRSNASNVPQAATRSAPRGLQACSLSTVSVESTSRSSTS